MDRARRFNILFIGSCIGAAVLACIVTARTMLLVIGWYLSKCGASPTASCSAADWLITYWWSVFVPVVLLAAFLLRRLYDRLLIEISRQD